MSRPSWKALDHVFRSHVLKLSKYTFLFVMKSKVVKVFFVHIVEIGEFSESDNLREINFTDFYILNHSSLQL